MSEFFTLGSQLRDLLRGLLEIPDSKRAPLEWGPRVDVRRLEDLYAPRRVEQYVVPRGGVDNLALHSTDMFTIPGRGEFTVDFSGYFRVARSHPTSDDWSTFEVLVNIIDLRMRGQGDGVGEVSVALNPDILSSGRIFPGAGPAAPAKCRIATAAIFEIPQLGIKVFNKEPILLMNEHVTSVPPVNDPSGHALLFMLPLYNLEDPHGDPLAYLTSLRYGADDYLTRAEVATFRGDS